MQKIVGVRRIKDREIYYFNQNIEDLKLGEKLVVNFEDFQTVVSVAKLGVQIEDDKASELNKIIRKATESDIKKYESLAKKAKEELPAIKRKSLELGLMMKFVYAEYSLDNSKILIVFSSEERVDFRQLLKELAIMLKIRIELKQIGQRDEAKICNSAGICGQQCCCSRFLKEFEHVTVKMAKVQGLSLAPTKINGVCGRLMCCLGYEAPFYEEMVKKMPKVGTEIETPSGLATVVYNDILREKVSVKRKSEGDSFIVEDFTLEELREGKRIEKTKNVNKNGEDENSVSAKIDEIMKKSAELLDEKPISNESKNNVEKVQNTSKNDKNTAENTQNQPKNNKNNHNKNVNKPKKYDNNSLQNSSSNLNDVKNNTKFNKNNNQNTSQKNTNNNNNSNRNINDNKKK